MQRTCKRGCWTFNEELIREKAKRRPSTSDLGGRHNAGPSYLLVEPWPNRDSLPRVARSSHQSNSIGTLFPLFFLFRPRPGLRIGFRRVFVLFPPLVEQVFTRVFFFWFTEFYRVSPDGTSTVSHQHQRSVICIRWSRFFVAIASERERERVQFR